MLRDSTHARARRGAIAGSVLACAAAALLAAPVGAGAATCVVAGPILTFTLSGEAATLQVTGNKISMTGAKCQRAPGPDEVTNIVVVGSGGVETLTINDAAQLAPGVTPEPSGISEIEIGVDLGAGADVLAFAGGAGNDVYVAGANGVDVNNDDDADVTFTAVERLALDGGAGSDTVSAAGDASTGGASALLARIVGGAGNDTLAGGSRNDVFVHEAGADLMLGGRGVDTVTYATATAGVLVSVGNRANDGLVGEMDHVGSDIEIVRGTAFADRLLGNAAANALFGFGGNDVIYGGAGTDVLRGGLGNDVLVGGLGADRMFGDAGADSLLAVDRVRDVLSGGLGVDRSRADAVDVRTRVERRF